MIPVGDDFPLVGPYTVFNWLPLAVIVFFGLLVNAILARVVDALHTVYYTLFHARINHAGELAPDMRAELDGYLEDGRKRGGRCPSRGRNDLRRAAAPRRNHSARGSCRVKA